MISALLVLSLLAAMWAERHGNRAVRPLVASVALVCVLTLAGVPFDFGLWVSIDVAVIAAIESFCTVGKAERAIIALFPLAWVLYQVQPPWWRDGVALIVTAQFFLTVPRDRSWQVIRAEKTA